MKILQKIFAVYAVMVFIGIFLSLFPLMFIFVHIKSARNINHWLYRIWGHLVFLLTGIWAKPTWKFKPKKGQVYLYCANHTSYADIPTMYISVTSDLTFIGKSSLGSVPLFGYIYRKIHILVNRKSTESKKEVIERAKIAIKNGVSPIIFPEGTIPKVGIKPKMIEFKDGAFRIAIDMKVPIVPVSILNNYRILPDDDKSNIRIFPSKVIFHEPIETANLSIDQVDALKKKTFNIIADSLDNHLSDLIL